MSSAVVVSSENLDEKQQSVSTPVVHAADKVNLLGMSRAELEDFLKIWVRRSFVLVRS